MTSSKCNTFQCPYLQYHHIGDSGFSIYILGRHIQFITSNVNIPPAHVWKLSVLCAKVRAFTPQISGLALMAKAAWPLPGLFHGSLRKGLQCCPASTTKALWSRVSTANLITLLITPRWENWGATYKFSLQISNGEYYSQEPSFLHDWEKKKINSVFNKL